MDLNKTELDGDSNKQWTRSWCNTLAQKYTLYKILCESASKHVIYRYITISGVATGGHGGAECPLTAKNLPKIREREGESQKKEGKIKKKRKNQKKRQNRERFITLPLLTDRAGYATDYNALKGIHTPNPKLECFVLYLKIIDAFFKNIVCILW